MPKMKDWRANSSTKTVGTLTGYYKKKQNMKDNVTITEEQIDITTKSWCSFNRRAKNQTFFKTAQHKPRTRYKKTTQGNKAQGCRRQCILKMQAQTSDVLHSSLSSSELSLCKLSVFIDILMLFLWKWFCSLWFCVWLIFIFEVCVWFLFCCKPCSSHLLKYPPQLLSESSSVLWVFVHFSVVPFFFMHFSCCRFSHISRFSLSSTRVWFSMDIIFYFGMLVYLPYLKVLC